MRSVVKTIISLLVGIAQNVDVSINDLEFDVVARSAVLLLLAFAAKESLTIEPSTLQ